MGISIELHLTFIIFFSLFLAAGITNFLFLGLIFTIVLAHELAHSITAKLSGIPVPKITLLPIGGLATIELPEDPMLELRVSMVGQFFYGRHMHYPIICLRIWANSIQQSHRRYGRGNILL